MSETKTARKKKDRTTNQTDVNVKHLSMGTWSPKHMRASQNSVSRKKGRGSRKLLKPPPGGWTGGNQ